MLTRHFSCFVFVLTFLASFNLKGQNANPIDSVILIEFYNATDGANWAPCNWTLTDPVNSWCGITLNGSGNVIEINLVGNNLNGCYPPQIDAFCSGVVLNISGNPNLPTNFPNFCNTGFGVCLSPCPSDSLTLVELYNSTDGANWVDNSNWLVPGQPIDTWYGVTLNAQGRVECLDLDGIDDCLSSLGAGNNLVGEIPEGIDCLVDLEKLYLANNSLSGSIPGSLGNLSNLTDISLENNQLNGCFPSKLYFLCATNYNFSNNLGLPNNGDFGLFCGNGSGECETCTTTSDSLALVALYNATEGEFWTNQWNLLSPMNTWYGVGVDNNGCVDSLNLLENNLVGSIPPDLGNMSNLNVLKLGRNYFTGGLPLELNNLYNLEVLTVQQCGLNFADLEVLISHPNFNNFSSFIYAPQYQLPLDSVSITIPPTDTLIVFDSTGILRTGLDGINTQYNWHVNEALVSEDDPNDDSITILVDSYDDGGFYQVQLTNPYFPALTLYSETEQIWTSGIDAFGGRFVYNQVIIEFEAGTPDTEIFALSDVLAATIVDSCMCGKRIQLWEFSFPTNVGYNGETNWTFDINEIKKRGEFKSDANGEIDRVNQVSLNNYFHKTNTQNILAKSFPQKKQNPSISNTINSSQDTITIAIIDTGIKDTLSFMPSNYFWENTNETIDNCIDDQWGYDFANQDSEPNANTNHIHATDMVAYIMDNMAPATNFKFMNIKASFDDGEGELFDAICSVHYAREKEAKIINGSWSYRGGKSEILENALQEASDENIFIVVSAGNGIYNTSNSSYEGQNLDANYFYPAAYDSIDYLITVGASNADTLLRFSNYSDTLVQLAAPGFEITPSWDNTELHSGTSYSTAFVSAMIANYLSKYPSSSPSDVINALQQSIIPMAVDSLEWNGQLDILSVSNSITHTTCGFSDGIAHINAQGGIKPYSYQWSNNGTNTHTQIGLSSGYYTVTTTDDVGFVVINSFQIYDGCTCPPSYSLNGNQSSSIYYETHGTINSNQLLTSSITVTYDAEQSIELLPGFEIQQGVDFSAFIDGCYIGHPSFTDEDNSILSSQKND